MGFKSDRFERACVSVILVAAFFGSLVLSVRQTIFISPDETANVFFARAFAGGHLGFFEPLNIPLNDALHPRSVISRSGLLVPGSFLGLPILYGTLSRLFGDAGLFLWTPIMAGLAVLAWYAVVKRLFEKEIAFIAAALLAVHPAWLYYANRGLMHNVPFTALVIFTSFFLIARPFTRSILNVFFSGVMLGLALAFRTSEIVWIAPALLIAAFFYWRSFTIRQGIVFVIAAFFAFMPVLVMNNALYGSPFITGYTAASTDQTAESFSPSTSALAAPGAAPATDVLDRPSVLFPFGIHPRAVAKNSYEYGGVIFFWMTALFLIGLLVVSLSKTLYFADRKTRKTYFVVFAFVAFWLLTMYGSWNVTDNPDPREVTIGNSYVRYWLPIYVFMTPIAAIGIAWLARHTLTGKWAGNTTRDIDWIRMRSLFLLLICALFSIKSVFFFHQDSLIPAMRTLDRSLEIRADVLAVTPADSVIIVDRADKIFFPYRRVLVPLRDERTYQLMPKIAELAPLYYYGITLPPEDRQYLNTQKLSGLGLRIDLVRTFDAESLYAITVAHQPI